MNVQAVLPSSGAAQHVYNDALESQPILQDHASSSGTAGGPGGEPPSPLSHHAQQQQHDGTQTRWHKFSDDPIVRTAAVNLMLIAIW